MYDCNERLNMFMNKEVKNQNWDTTTCIVFGHASLTGFKRTRGHRSGGADGEHGRVSMVKAARCK